MDDLRESVLAEIRRILATELQRSEPVEPHHELVKDLRLDSLGAVVLAVGLEDRFRVTLDEALGDTVVTVADLVEEVVKARDAAAGPGTAP